MKYNIDNITGAQYLNMINREEDPDSQNLDIKYCRIGDAYCAYSNSAYGKILTPQFRKNGVTDEEIEAYFDEATKNITDMYNAKKESFITPNSLIIDPRRGV